jgi:hypothetical protein
MRKLFPMLTVAAVFSCVSLVVIAVEVKTVTGEGQCAKCSLNETKACQNAVVVDEAGKKVTYYFEKNKVANDFHGQICKATKKIKATGDVQQKDGKMVITATQIDVVE